MLLGLVLLLLASAGGLYVMEKVLRMPGPAQEATTVLIPRGASSRDIARILEERGVVASRWLVLAELVRQRALGRQRHIQAGEFRIPPGASVREIVRLLQSGKAILYRVTIPEGFSVIQVVERLQANPHLTGEIEDMPPEGSLLPDTYAFQRGESRQALIRRMQEAQRRLLDELWPKRAADLPFRTRKEAIILASIVEKETALPHERRRIAAVFINRLKKGMRLQADPTVIYGITRGKPLRRPLTRRDLETDHPWNTYRIRGLPPTPIANPGRESIAAVLNPERTDDLYFVADGSGGHVFASTLKEHNENVRRWRRIRREMRAREEARRNGAERPRKAGPAQRMADGRDGNAGPSVGAAVSRPSTGENEARPRTVDGIPLPRPRPFRTPPR